MFDKRDDSGGGRAARASQRQRDPDAPTGRLDARAVATYFPSRLNTNPERTTRMPPVIDDERHLAEQQLDETFAALANATRRAMLARLAEGPATVTELAEPFDVSLPAISKHLRVLERAGLVEQHRRAQYRPCALNAEPLQAVASWAEHYRPIWESRFDRMADYLQELDSRRTHDDD